MPLLLFQKKVPPLGPFAGSSKAVSALQGPSWALLGLGSPHEPQASVSDTTNPQSKGLKNIKRLLGKKLKILGKKLKITAKTQLEAPSPAFHGTDGASKSRTGAKDLVHAQCFPGILHAVLTA